MACESDKATLLKQNLVVLTKAIPDQHTAIKSEDIWGKPATDIRSAHLAYPANRVSPAKPDCVADLKSSSQCLMLCAIEF